MISSCGRLYGSSWSHQRAFWLLLRHALKSSPSVHSTTVNKFMFRVNVLDLWLDTSSLSLVELANLNENCKTQKRKQMVSRDEMSKLKMSFCKQYSCYTQTDNFSTVAFSKKKQQSRCQVRSYKLSSMLLWFIRKWEAIRVSMPIKLIMGGQRSAMKRCFPIGLRTFNNTWLAIERIYAVVLLMLLLNQF